MANNCLRSSFHHFLYTCTAIHAFAGEVEKMRHLVLLLMWWFSQCSIIFSLKVLDACSAPGNKTVHLAALMRGKGKIIACELNKERVIRLKETIKLSGASSILLWSFSSFKYHSILFYLFDISFLLQNCWTISNLPTVMSIHDHCDSFLIYYSTMFRSIFFGVSFSSISTHLSTKCYSLIWILDIEVLHGDFLNCNPNDSSFSKVKYNVLCPHSCGL